MGQMWSFLVAFLCLFAQLIDMCQKVIHSLLVGFWLFWFNSTDSFQLKTKIFTSIPHQENGSKLLKALTTHKNKLSKYKKVWICRFFLFIKKISNIKVPTLRNDSSSRNPIEYYPSVINVDITFFIEKRATRLIARTETETGEA